MRRKISWLFTALLCLLSLPLYAQTVAASSTANPKAAQPGAAVPQRGSLYRISHQGNTTYLFGTIHVGQPTFYPLEPQVMDALARSTKLVVELDIRNHASFDTALKKHGFYPANESLEQQLSADSIFQLQRALEKFGMSVDQVKHMKPWLVANLLLGLDLERHGYSRSHGLEYFLLSPANVQAKPVLELESADYQLSLFDGMSAYQQEQYLRENLVELTNGQALKKAQHLLHAWSSGDSNQVDAFLQQSRKEQTVSSEFIQRVLLDQRNPAMATKIEGLLQQDEISFVGVGLLHLVGNTGVPTLLRQRGYQVEKLY